MATKSIIKSERPFYKHPNCFHLKKSTKSNKSKTKHYSCSGSINRTTSSLYCQHNCCLKCAAKYLGEHKGKLYCNEHHPLALPSLPCGHLSDSFVKCKECDNFRDKLIEESKCLACHQVITLSEKHFCNYHARCIPELCHKCGQPSASTFQNRGWCKRCLMQHFNSQEILNSSISL